MSYIINPYLFNFNPVFLLDASDLATITKDPSNFVSAWNDKSIAGNDTKQLIGSKQPIWNSGNYITMDGVNDYVEADSFISAKTDTDVSLSFWINIVGNGSVSWNGLIDNVSGFARTRILINNSRAEIRIDLEANVSIPISPALSLATWYKLDITKDSINGLKFYLNGSLHGADSTKTGVINGSNLGTLDATTTGSIIGMGDILLDFFYSNIKYGEVVAWNRAITATEVSNFFEAQRATYGI